MLITLQGPVVAHPGVPDPTAMVDAARWLGENGGIDTLVVALGSNNVVSSVVKLRLVWSSGPHSSGYDAQEALAVMAHSDATLPKQVDFARLVAADTLISDPPRSLTGNLGAVRFANELIDLGLVLLGRRAV